MKLKQETLRSTKLRKSAMGEECTLQIYGVCNCNPETTVLAHLNFTGSVMGSKAPDLDACYACSSCHDVWDGRARWPDSERTDREWYGARAIVRTHIRMIEKGVLKV